MPSRYYKLVLPFILLLLALGLAMYVGRASLHENHDAVATSSPSITTPVATTTTSSVPSTAAKISLPTSISPAAASATFVINGKSYVVVVKDSETVDNAMQSLENSGALTYTEKTYAGMGEFIESINGVANDTTSSWIFYVNGKESDTGISSTPLHVDDVITWKYEK